MYYNHKTKRPYSGKNIEILEATGLKGGFMTFRQAIELGFKVPAGTKAIAKIIRPITINTSLQNSINIFFSLD